MKRIPVATGLSEKQDRAMRMKGRESLCEICKAEPQDDEFCVGVGCLPHHTIAELLGEVSWLGVGKAIPMRIVVLLRLLADLSSQSGNSIHAARICRCRCLCYTQK